jgi:hypothetical protein
MTQARRHQLSVIDMPYYHVVCRSVEAVSRAELQSIDDNINVLRERLASPA